MEAAGGEENIVSSETGGGVRYGGEVSVGIKLFGFEFFVSVLVLVLGFVCYFFFFLMVYCVMILDFFKGCDSVCWCV